MNNPNAIYQTGVPLLPPPPPLPSQQSAPRLSHQRQQQYSTGYPAGSPHQPQNIAATQSQFLPSQPSSQLQHHPSYAAQPPNIIHQPADPGFYTHPSPYSTASATGSYTSSDPNEAMAQAAMSRQPQQFPPILQTPQSQSPASIHSPHYDATGRSSYGGYPSMGQPAYYGGSIYTQPSGPTYTPQPPITQSYATPAAYPQQPAASQSYTTAAPAYPQHPSAPQSYPAVTSSYLHHASYPPQPQVPSQPQQNVESKSSSAQLSRSSMSQAPPPTQQTPIPQHQQAPVQQTAQPTLQTMPLQSSTTQSRETGSASSAAPGPIPATTPLVVRQDQNGVQWIMFEYSRDRVKMQYTIRCDVESVKSDDLSQEFKSANCVYPRACGPKEGYKGNRLAYETECNAVGWALAQLNPNLREKRGLIQRAVDSWRNSNRDPRLRSRRVRRQAKIDNRKSSVRGPTTPVPSSSMQIPQTLQPPRTGSSAPLHLHTLHHHGEDPRAVDEKYNTATSTQQHIRPHPNTGLASPVSMRYNQSFYPRYPARPSNDTARMPPINDSIDTRAGASSGMPAASSLGTPQSTPTISGLSRSPVAQDNDPGQDANTIDFDNDDDRDRALFGNIPTAKRRKFLLVEDPQRGGRIRVKVSLEDVNMDDMPDDHLMMNAVHPRSYYPRVMRSPTSGSKRSAFREDFDDAKDDAASARGKTFVPIRMLEGRDIELAVPRISRARRKDEMMVNELGYRMAWGQARLFAGRRIFLQRALDHYRETVHQNHGTNADADIEDIPSHFEVRPGRRKLMQRLSTQMERKPKKKRPLPRTDSNASETSHRSQVLKVSELVQHSH